MTGRALRLDIQALRGISVLMVVLYHAKVPGFGKGYLGVDVFFVISGFLITGLVTSALRRGEFSLAEFYRRRALRLLPAAAVTLVGVTLLSLWLLPQGDVLSLRAQLLGAATYTANIVLWQQGDYFGGEAALRPLLHFWSLAVEEQFYLLLPPLLMLLAPRRWFAALGFIAVASFACWLWATPAPWAFYLLPARAWELAIGGVLALAFAERPLPPLPLLSGGPQARLLGWFGDRSYALYLVHWPLFSLLVHVWMGKGADGPPITLRLALVVVALLLAELLHRGVERPLRRPERYSARQTWTAVSASTAALVILAFAAPRIAARDASAADYRARNTGLHLDCAYTDGFVPRAECVSGPKPRILLWGDSHAMQWAPGLAASGDVAFAQATRVQCGPLLGVAPFIETRAAPMAWAESCMQFNQDVLKYLDATPSIEVVMLGSIFWRYLYASLPLVDNQGELKPGGEPLLLAALKVTADSLRARGKRVIVLAPPPNANFDIARCHERRSTGKPVLGLRAGCDIVTARYVAERAAVRQFLERAAAFVPVVHVEPLLCDAERCRTTLDGTVLYADDGHLSRPGAVVLAKRLSLNLLAMQAAY